MRAAACSTSSSSRRSCSQAANWSHRTHGVQPGRVVVCRSSSAAQQQAASEDAAQLQAAPAPAAAAGLPAHTRRALLTGVAAAAAAIGVAVAAPHPAHAGLERYVKKRALDPLDTYVPLVLEARDTLAGLGPVMASDPGTARAALRSGAFAGMRDNVRALGEYAARPAAEGGAGLGDAAAGALVQGFFRALERYDLTLYQAVRAGKAAAQAAAKGAGNDADAAESAVAALDPAAGLDAGAAGEQLQAAVGALDALVATVPGDVLERSRAVLDKVAGRS